MHSLVLRKLNSQNAILQTSLSVLHDALHANFASNIFTKVDAYFARFHFLLPVVDKPLFLRKFANIMDNSHNLDIVRSETPFLSLVFAVFACAANLVQDSRLSTSERHDDGGMGMVYYERYVVVCAAESAHLTLAFSALILQYISHPNTQVVHVQCFILMSSFLCSVNCLPQAWILIGQAVRTGQDLGLHVRNHKSLF